MTVSLVVAAAANDVIGRDGALPWHLPEDMRRFRARTAGHVVVMGRLTHESILARLGHPLEGRTSVVVSRTLPETRTGPGDAQPPAGEGRVLIAGSVESALAAAASISALAGRGEFFVLGGESVYRQALPSVERIYLTRVHATVDGDRSMPADWLAGFELVSREDTAGPGSGAAYSFCEYRRSPS